MSELTSELATRAERSKKMSGNQGLITIRSSGEPYRIVKERLKGSNTDLTSFFFHHGANVYVFSYEKEGVRRHTFIDTGDSQYRNQILPILIENDINPAEIERIVITHRHPDHCGLADLLARESGAKILVHSNFSSFVEGEINQEERSWLGGFNPSQLKECNIEYLPQSGRSELISINGLDFPSLIEPIEMGQVGKLVILACPESTSTHSPDQIIILYSPKGYPHTYDKAPEDFCPTDDILFSGDLWLMRGPIYDWGMRSVSRQFKHGFDQMKNLVSGESMVRRDPRIQDSMAKEALKKGFCLIRVKPGHGEEFIGSRIIPNSLLADRDLLLELGYSQDTGKSILKSRDLAPKVATIREQGYISFVRELLLWMELGCTLDETCELLVRIYKEQSGGGALVEEDRKERRERLKVTLVRLKDDEAESDELRQLAESTLSKLRGVS